MNKAYSTFEIKAFDDDARTLEGIASTPAPDRMLDVVEPTGAQYKLPLPLLWQHAPDQPIGHITDVEVRDKGLYVKGSVTKIDEPGPLRDRLDEAWQSLKHKLVRGLSIGFNPVEWDPLKDGGMHFTKWDWLELSAVTIPAQQEATITAVKHFANADCSARVNNSKHSVETVRRHAIKTTNGGYVLTYPNRVTTQKQDDGTYNLR